MFKILIVRRQRLGLHYNRLCNTPGLFVYVVPGLPFLFDWWNNLSSFEGLDNTSDGATCCADHSLNTETPSRSAIVLHSGSCVTQSTSCSLPHVCLGPSPVLILTVDETDFMNSYQHVTFICLTWCIRLCHNWIYYNQIHCNCPFHAVQYLLLYILSD